MQQLDKPKLESALPVKINRFDKEFFLNFIRQNYALILLSLILLLALILRVYNLADNPVGLNQDEAVNGVDAYAIAHTLRDHHGNFLPPMLESFEDWASSSLTYLTVPFVWLLGLSEFSVRLPIALSGVAAVLLMYLFVKRITGKKDLALLASFFLCIMPWHIFASRWAVPPDVVPFLLLLTLYVYFEFSASKTRVWKFALVGFCAALLAYSYSTQKMFAPLLLGAFFFMDLFAKTPWRPLFQKHIAICGTYLLLTSPIYLLTLLDPGKYNVRFAAISIFSLSGNPVVEFSKRYLSYYFPEFNFGDAIQSMVEHMPRLENTYRFLAVFYFAGIIWCGYSLFSKKPFIVSKPVSFLLLFWLLAFPIPASLTQDYFHTTRAMHGFPLVIIFSVIGIGFLLNFVKRKAVLALIYMAILVLSGFFLAHFNTLYFEEYPKISQEAFQYGIKGYSEYLLDNDAEFSSVKIDSRINMPYIFYLFYSAKDPRQYNYAEIKVRVPAADGWTTVPKIGKYTFGEITPEDLTNTTEIYAVKGSDNFNWYKIFSKDKNWFVVRQY